MAHSWYTLHSYSTNVNANNHIAQRQQIPYKYTAAPCLNTSAIDFVKTQLFYSAFNQSITARKIEH